MPENSYNTVEPISTGHFVKNIYIYCFLNIQDFGLENTYFKKQH